MRPGEFQIPAAKSGDFQLLVVERCTHAVYLDDARPRLIVPDPSDMVARSIVDDYKTAMLGYIHDVAEPGIDWVQGEFQNDVEGKKTFSAVNAVVLEEMRRLQRGWYESLLRIADDDWGRYRQHKFITDLQRHAAMELGQTNREWLIQARIEEALSKCKFCFSQIHPDAIVCPHCMGDQRQKEYSRLGAVVTAVK